MTSKQRELAACINKTERFSGWDSYDSAEGDMGYFEDADGLDGDEGMDGEEISSSAAGRPSLSVSDPYVVQYENTTTGDLAAVLFGYNDYFDQTNYGNAVGITVTNVQGGTYRRLLAQTNNKNFKIGKWRFQCSTSSQLQQTLNIVHVDANGKSYTTPMNLSIMRDAYQMQADILDITKPVSIDGNTHLAFTLKGSAVLTISMFPTTILSGKAKLNGSNGVTNNRTPRLSGKNVAPVIIQTTQDVKSVAKS